MALGFKKSIFGYNCEEVSEYLHKKDNEHKQSLLSLDKKIDNLKKELSLSFEANKDLSEQLDYYKTKYDEVKTLSENIGKLYLVAQSNAKSIINSANETRIKTENQIDNNLLLINGTNNSLAEFKEELINLSSNFAAEIDKLTKTLQDIKQSSAENRELSDTSIENFERFYNTITK